MYVFVRSCFYGLGEDSPSPKESPSQVADEAADLVLDSIGPLSDRIVFQTREHTCTALDLPSESALFNPQV